MDKFLQNNKNIIKSINFLIEWKNGFKFILKKSDLTIQDTNAIVNAANNELWLGSGVAGAIKKKGGPQIQNECNDFVKKRGNLINGEVVHTGKGQFNNDNLKYIFHAVGPVYRNGKLGEPEELGNAFKNSFLLADKLGVESISMPPISSGIFGYPKKACARKFYEVLKDYISDKIKNNKDLILKEVRMTIIDEETFSEFVKIHNEIIQDYDEFFKEEIDKFWPDIPIRKNIENDIIKENKSNKQEESLNIDNNTLTVTVTKTEEIKEEELNNLKIEDANLTPTQK